MAQTGSKIWKGGSKLKNKTAASIRSETMQQYNARTGSNVPF
jgi:hypothetical protein